jgi:uncharacterized protein involved in exopolysaccharide biosynthesis
MEQEHSLFDISNVRDILTILFKHKFKIFATFLIICIGVTMYAFQLPKTYESKSVLMVKLGREFLARSEVGPDTARSSVSPETIMRGELSILTSRDLLIKVINVLKPETIYPDLARSAPGTIKPTDEALARMEADLSVVVQRGSSLIEITFSHMDPNIAAQVVNTLVELFKEKHLEVFSATSTGFLENQRTAFEEKLKSAEGGLITFKQKSGVFSYDEQKSALLQQRTVVDTNLQATLIQIKEAEEKIVFVKSPRWSVEGAPELRTVLSTLQQRERESLEKYTENSRVIQNIRKEIEAAKEGLRRNIDDLRRIELSRVEGELSVLQTRASSLKRQFAQIDSEIRSLDTRGKGLQDLKREVAQHESNYQNYSKKLEESLIADEMDRLKMVAISVIEKATPSPLPKKQRFSKSQLIPMGFFGGIAAGIALAFLLELLSPGMTTPLSAERRLGIPVMVAITKKG